MAYPAHDGARKCARIGSLRAECFYFVCLYLESNFFFDFLLEISRTHPSSNKVLHEKELAARSFYQDVIFSYNKDHTAAATSARVERAGALRQLRSEVLKLDLSIHNLLCSLPDYLYVHVLRRDSI